MFLYFCTLHNQKIQNKADKTTNKECLTELFFYFVAVVGRFESVANEKMEVKGAVINEPLKLPCPPHSYSYGVTRSWTNTPVQDRRLMVEPNGDLLISNVIAEDAEWSDIGTACKISNRYGEAVESTRYQIRNIAKGILHYVLSLT